MKSRIARLIGTTALAGAAAGALAASAAELSVPAAKFHRLDHVFLIIMENQPETAIIGNANAPFMNRYAKQANFATNYFAVGHPSAPNYLEIVGGSNFHVTNDFWPAWSAGGCVDNAPGSTACNNAVPPISAAGLDNAVVATATTSTDCNGDLRPAPTPAPNNCALRDYPAAYFTPKSIADQLVQAGRTWKAYEESLPTVVPGVNGVNYSDGVFSNLSPAPVFAAGAVQQLYAVKHNPFAYFATVQSGGKPGLGLEQIVDFDGPNGLWADLQDPRHTPSFSLIVPNQCHDMHSTRGGSAVCSASTPARAALLMQEADAAVAKLVNGVKNSPAWSDGANAIIVVFDENDYSNSANRVYLTTELNFAPNGATSANAYDHFSLLRSLEAGFGLPCLNHACDATSKVMDDMFGR